LKDEIENMLKQGKLQKYVDQSGFKEDDRKRQGGLRDERSRRQSDKEDEEADDDEADPDLPPKGVVPKAQLP